ncbi:MAG: hypothetical protein HY901_23450 [Deltaproteobacteria bacterium]|nr:hypothetical protein [Deltaproteobacteria bacterium]
MHPALIQLVPALKSRAALVEWAKSNSQQELEAVWRICPDARALLTLALPVTRKEDLLRVACSCIRAASKGHKETRGFAKALNTLEAYAGGKATWDAVKDSGEKVFQELGGSETDCTTAVFMATGIKDEPRYVIDVAETTAKALSDNDGALVYDTGVGGLAPAKGAMTKAGALKLLADVVRGTIPCPDIASLQRLGDDR